MEAKLTRNFIKDAIDAETESAKKNWGPRYSSNHEAYAVLKEEVEEAADDLTIIQEDLDLLWNAVKGNSELSYNAALTHIIQVAEELATEAVQIAAVARKAKGL